MINPRSIGVRLTGWYLLILLLGLGTFGLSSWFAIRASVFHALDDELLDRVRGVQKFMQLQIASLSPNEIRDEFREHSVLGPGGDLFQVCDATGVWLYRSAVLENSQTTIRLPSELSDAAVFEHRTVQDTPVRFATQKVIVNGRAYSIQVAAPMKEFFEAMHRFGVALWLIVPLLIAGAVIGGFWISRRALRPVDEITLAAESISVSNLTRRLDVSASGDELQRLAETMNRMLGRLDSAFQKMSQFTADASHELRAPISVILATSEMAASGGRTLAELQEDMVQIKGEAERTKRLIDSLLLLARADAGEDRLQMEPTNLSALVTQVIVQVRRAWPERAIVFDSQAPVTVSGDPDGLRRLVFILLDNAIKYSAPAGLVQVALVNRDGQAECTVGDTGMGIAPEHLDHVFDRFWRADRVRSRGTGGAGLGLSIARWIVDRHHGTISVQSKVGEGTAFTITLPTLRVSEEIP